jgi:hypothetical protein
MISVRKTVLVAASIIALSSTVMAAEWGYWTNGVPWGNAFPEREKFNILDPRGAAAVAGGRIQNPEELIQDWQQLPNDLHQQDCGKDTVGQAKRCLDMTFQGSGQYVGTSVTAHFDTIGGSWHFLGFDVR